MGLDNLNNTMTFVGLCSECLNIKNMKQLYGPL